MAISAAAQAALDQLQHAWGRPLQITSGYRDPAKNASVGGAKGSQHIHGNAFDISAAGMSPDERLALASLARDAGFRGFGFYDNSLHFDVGAPRAWGPDYHRGSVPDWAKSWVGQNIGGGGSASSVAASAPSAPNTGTMPMGLLDMQDEPQTFAERIKSQWQSGELGDRIALAANTLRLNPDENLAAALQDRQQAREQKSTMNRTAQWLISQGRGDLAQAMLTGAVDPKSAVAVAMQPADPLAAIQLEKAQIELQNLKEPQPGFRAATPEEAAAYGASSGQFGPDGKFYPSETQIGKGVVVDKRVINPVTGEVIYEPPQGANVTLTDEQLSNINTMRDDLRTQTATFDIVKNGFDNIQAFYSSPGAVSDYALAVGFAKIVDPGSVAREGEVAAVAGAGAMFPALGTALKNAFDGTGKLTPQTRAEIFALAQKMYVNKANDTVATIGRYKELAKRAGLPEDMLWMGGNISMPGPQVTPQPQPSPTIDTMPPPGTAPRPTLNISPKAQTYLP